MRSTQTHHNKTLLTWHWHADRIFHASVKRGMDAACSPLPATTWPPIQKHHQIQKHDFFFFLTAENYCFAAGLAWICSLARQKRAAALHKAGAPHTKQVNGTLLGRLVGAVSSILSQPGEAHTFLLSPRDRRNPAGHFLPYPPLCPTPDSNTTWHPATKVSRRQLTSLLCPELNCLTGCLMCLSISRYRFVPASVAARSPCLPAPSVNCAQDQTLPGFPN